MKGLCIILALFPGLSASETVFASRTIRANSIILSEYLTIKDVAISGMVRDARSVVGKEARVAIYAGRPIHPADIGPPALVARNQIVQINYKRSGLVISVEGRSLGRGGVGDRVRVMNSSSRSTISGIVAPDGSIHVLQ